MMKPWEIDYLRCTLEDGEVYTICSDEHYRVMVFPHKIMISTGRRMDREEFSTVKPNLPSQSDYFMKRWWGFTNDLINSE